MDARFRTTHGIILIDTSCWVEALRERGDADVRRQVQGHMLSGDARWNSVVRLELWNGARGEREKKVLREFEGVLPELSMPTEVWELAYELARRARAAGRTIPIADLLICACARYHQVEVLSVDEHFAALAEL